jgi:hypothetical protein
MEEVLTRLALENAALQHQILLLTREQQPHKDRKDRWAHYHAHKDRLRQEHPDATWQQIKRLSDQEFVHQEVAP